MTLTANKKKGSHKKNVIPFQRVGGLIVSNKTHRQYSIAGSHARNLLLLYYNKDFYASIRLYYQSNAIRERLLIPSKCIDPVRGDGGQQKLPFIDSFFFLVVLNPTSENQASEK